MTKVKNLKPIEKPYTFRLTPDVAGGYIATIQELPGCVAEGDSSEEAITNITKAAHSWMDAARHLGQKIPEPISLSEYSGKIALRVPRSIHKQAAELSLLEGVSTNQLLLTAISNYLGGKEVFDKMATSFLEKINQYLLFSCAAAKTVVIVDALKNANEEHCLTANYPQLSTDLFLLPNIPTGGPTNG